MTQWTIPIDPEEDFDDLIPLEEFIENCKIGLFTDSDGFGEAVRNGMKRDISNIDYWDSVIYPTDGRFGNVPIGTTHIMWYNN